MDEEINDLTTASESKAMPSDPKKGSFSSILQNIEISDHIVSEFEERSLNEEEEEEKALISEKNSLSQSSDDLIRTLKSEVRIVLTKLNKSVPDIESTQKPKRYRTKSSTFTSGSNDIQLCESENSNNFSLNISSNQKSSDESTSKTNMNSSMNNEHFEETSLNKEEEKTLISEKNSLSQSNDDSIRTPKSELRIILTKLNKSMPDIESTQKPKRYRIKSCTFTSGSNDIQLCESENSNNSSLNISSNQKSLDKSTLKTNMNSNINHGNFEERSLNKEEEGKTLISDQNSLSQSSDDLIKTPKSEVRIVLKKLNKSVPDIESTQKPKRYRTKSCTFTSGSNDIQLCESENSNNFSLNISSNQKSSDKSTSKTNMVSSINNGHFEERSLNKEEEEHTLISEKNSLSQSSDDLIRTLKSEVRIVLTKLNQSVLDIESTQNSSDSNDILLCESENINNFSLNISSNQESSDKSPSKTNMTSSINNGNFEKRSLNKEEEENTLILEKNSLSQSSDDLIRTPKSEVRIVLTKLNKSVPDIESTQKPKRYRTKSSTFTSDSNDIQLCESENSNNFSLNISSNQKSSDESTSKTNMNSSMNNEHFEERSLNKEEEKILISEKNSISQSSDDSIRTPKSELRIILTKLNQSVPDIESTQNSSDSNDILLCKSENSNNFSLIVCSKQESSNESNSKTNMSSNINNGHGNINEHPHNINNEENIVKKDLLENNTAGEIITKEPNVCGQIRQGTQDQLVPMSGPQLEIFPQEINHIRQVLSINEQGNFSSGDNIGESKRNSPQNLNKAYIEAEGSLKLSQLNDSVVEDLDFSVIFNECLKENYQLKGTNNNGDILSSDTFKMKSKENKDRGDQSLSMYREDSHGLSHTSFEAVNMMGEVTMNYPQKKKQRTNVVGEARIKKRKLCSDNDANIKSKVPSKLRIQTSRSDDKLAQKPSSGVWIYKFVSQETQSNKPSEYMEEDVCLNNHLQSKIKKISNIPRVFPTVPTASPSSTGSTTIFKIDEVPSLNANFRKKYLCNKRNRQLDPYKGK